MTDFKSELRKILDEQFKRLDGTVVLPIYNRPTAVGQALDDIIALFISKLPKQKDAFYEEAHPDKYHEENLKKYGYNQCLDDIKGITGTLIEQQVDYSEYVGANGKPNVPLMTGQEWYNKFEKELYKPKPQSLPSANDDGESHDRFFRDGGTNFMYSKAIEAAQRASGIKGEIE